MSKNNVNINREYKASLFSRIFSEPKAALSLYNSLNGTDYDDPTQLEINTIESVLYIGWKNDVSFLIDSSMNLYEHQATWNPNMPLRGLFYFSDLYRGYVASQSLDIYTSVPLKLPAPRYTVFYNGTREEPEIQELRLSDLYSIAAGSPILECTAQVMNINFGHNRALMERCRQLYEYSYFIDTIRRHLKNGLTLNAAVERTVEECIAGNILKDFLSKHKAEVANMIMPEFNAQLHDQTTHEIGFNEGERAGIAETICDMLSDICQLPDVWREKIMSAQDIDVLKSWHRIARRSESLDEFLKKSGLSSK